MEFQQLCRRIKQLFDKMQGYRFGVVWCAVAAGAACLINLIFTAWALTHDQISNGSLTIHDGSCTEAKKLDMWLHLAINGLSTIVLGVSNYTMQCLSAPTRVEIDKAHRNSMWLDIGIPSLRNLLKISRARLVLWVIVAASSLPLHLLYNSAIFTTIAANEYSVYTVSQSFLTGAPFTITFENLFSYSDAMTSDDGDNLTSIDILESIRRENASIDILNKKACINAYSTEFLSARGSVLLITTDSPMNNSVLTWSTPRQLRGSKSSASPYDWMYFTDPVRSYRIGSNGLKMPVLNWSAGICRKDHSLGMHLGHKIDHCVSQRRPQYCQVQFSVYIMIVVIVCNFAKFVIMIYLAWNKQEDPLITSGDAISSFLDQPDPTTIKACMTDQKSYTCKQWDAVPHTWHRRRYFWFQALGFRSAFLSNSL